LTNGRFQADGNGAGRAFQEFQYSPAGKVLATKTGTTGLALVTGGVFGLISGKMSKTSSFTNIGLGLASIFLRNAIMKMGK